MKFSEKRKRKIKKKNQQKINKCCKNVIGYCVDYGRDAVVIDQAKINDTMYLLTTDKDCSQYAIYKIVKVGEYKRLSDKEILNNPELSNQTYWKEKCQIKIDSDGKVHLENTIFM